MTVSLRCDCAFFLEKLAIIKCCLRLSESVARQYNLLSDTNFPTLRIGGRKMVMKSELIVWLKRHTNRQE